MRSLNAYSSGAYIAKITLFAICAIFIAAATVNAATVNAANATTASGAAVTNAGAEIATAPNTNIDRYIFAIGANNGNKNQVQLRYAESDAESFVKVMQEMGGVPAKNTLILKSPSAASISESFAKLGKQISQSKGNSGRQEVLVYYSGHADEKGLQFEKDFVSWKELRTQINGIPAEVKIAVIDACGSGTITRMKGGKSVPAFMVDESSDMKGYAFITSSTGDEVSQESDKINGSFFTHSLVSGLRGAGDVSGDGKVTLSEAYLFAFNETLQKTQSTIGGAQHPSRDMNLVGTGDVVMTDLRSTSASLTFDTKLEGRIFIREGNSLIAELYKKAGRNLELGLPEGSYNVQMTKTSSSEMLMTEIALKNGSHIALQGSDFQVSALDKTTARGTENGRPFTANQKASLDSLDKQDGTSFTFNLMDSDKDPRKGVQLGFFGTFANKNLIGTQISLFANIAKENMVGAQVTTGFNFARNKEGAQITTLLNLARNIEGPQISATNIAKYASLQIGTMNIAATAPVQISVLNISDSSDVSVGTMNVNANFEDSQVGIINIANKAKGPQVGIINYCTSCETTPVGILSIVGNGVWALTAGIDEMGGTNLNARFGTAKFFTSFEGSRLHKKDNFFEYQDIYMTGMGFGTQFGRYGTHLGLDYTFLINAPKLQDNFGFDMEREDASAFHHRLRLYGTAKLFTGLGITSGISMNVVTEGYSDGIVQKPRGEWHGNYTIGGRDVRIWPGFFAGFTLGRF